METLLNKTEDNAEKTQRLLNPPKLEKPLVMLYKTIKRLQNYCITINTQPNIAWKDFMEVYRFNLDALQDNIIETLLSKKNQQLQLRELSTEYLDTISPLMLQTFEEIQNFSSVFSECNEDFQRGINDMVGGSPDRDYAVAITYLLGEISANQAKNKEREKKLSVFSKKIKLTYVALIELKFQAEFFFDEQREEIKHLAQELQDLETIEDKNNAQIIETSYQTKKTITFSIITDTNNSSHQDYEKKSAKEEEEEFEKNKQKLKNKIKKLQQQLAEYDSDYANLNSIINTCILFRRGLFSLRKDAIQTKHTWNSLATFLTNTEKTLDNVNTEKEWITNSLIPIIIRLNDYFIDLNKTITDCKKILPMEINIAEKIADDFKIVGSEKVPNSTMLNFYIKKMSNE